MHRRSLVSVVLIALFCIYSAPSKVNAGELRYGRWSPFCPYTCDYKKSGLHGTVIEIFMAVAKMNGFTYRDVPVPSKRKYRALDKDLSNITTVWSTNAKAMARTITANEAVVAPRFATVARRGFEFQLRKLKDVTSVRVAFSDGTDIDNDLANYLQDPKNADKVTLIYGKNVVNRSMAMVQHGRVDIMISNMDPVAYLIKTQNKSDKLEATYAPYLGKAFVFPGFSKKNPKAQKYADMFTDGIRKLRKSGELGRILAAYGLTDWATKVTTMKK